MTVTLLHLFRQTVFIEVHAHSARHLGFLSCKRQDKNKQTNRINVFVPIFRVQLSPKDIVVLLKVRKYNCRLSTLTKARSQC